MGVFLNVVDGGGQTGTLAHGDDALRSQQLQSACLVGGVVGNGDGGAVGNVGEVIALARVDAERLVVDGAYADQMGAVLGVEAVQIGGVLEVVGVHLTVFGDEVGLDVVAEFLDLQRDALLGEDVLGNLQNLGVGRGGSGNDQLGTGEVVGAFGSGAVNRGAVSSGGGSSLRGCGGRGCGRRAAGGKAQGQGCGKRGRK